MDDQQLWDIGSARLRRIYLDLPDATILSLNTLLTRYRKAKELISVVITGVAAALDCCECGGQCCQNGKYRINVLDALACIAAEISITTVFSQKPVCPYGNVSGCTLEPQLRPADCVMFMCDTINQKLLPQMALNLTAQEQTVRECIDHASRLVGERMATPLLIWAEKQSRTQ